MRPKAQTAALLASPGDTEQQFYEALQSADLERLMEVWADEDEISCVHPGGQRLVGVAAIRSAFEALFARGPVAAAPERVRKLQTQDTAIHQVLERVNVAGPEGTMQSAWVIATNVYLKTALGWRLAAHHASPGTPADMQDMLEEPTTLH
ncbi:SgcJ/EcaC family oxidoreductase [Paucibacter sp. R3-3]|uniref:SgcJ/EcaC family oxidoreductase n=1 Tax=Roseateles agri TaxID=3098619 RepID=A0ABU5DF94_9BURK|nr:SgcJ/EcaC family oxidoreductase [Paucibacter sp. R3-3]MDY0744819.1 SgcJ/EcaC family oxidoreductase [Paucibacter sp. R3-3]